MVSGCYDKTIKVWDLNTGFKKTLKGHTSCVFCVAISPDGKRIVSCSQDTTVKVWGLPDPE
ncbi:WD40 repeat domain-containing protein [Calothrix sp. NIES-2100]|uniref:WD40 repeat domain-containing protein n=1 Tax=Calothrix sp. NIES-2100 TaxID=1954172 RepID=UPI00403F8FDB